MKHCRECNQPVAADAVSCPNCGAQYPSQKSSSGWGFEYKDKHTLFGLPIVHVSFKYKSNGTPVPAKGIIAIGQFAVGVINISQFGIGVVSVSQVSIGAFVLAQVAIGYDILAQAGLYLNTGVGQAVKNVFELLGY